MRIHHIEFLCRDVKLQVHKFCHSFGFLVYGTWRDGLCHGREKTVLKKNSIYFVMQEDAKAVCDYVQNIAFEVESVGEICKGIPKEFMVVDATTLADVSWSKSIENNILDDGNASRVEAAILKSPIGKLEHTLIEKSGYTGPFLPNFTLEYNIESQKYINAQKGSSPTDQINASGIECHKNENNSLVLDHITFAVTTGTSFDLMEWYSNFLKMSRCKVNNEEENDGFKVETLNGSGERLGLKLTAMQYHFCSEQSMQMKHKNVENGDVKIVFAESLLGQGPNQVDTFLKENDGPGVQHIGLLSANIFASVNEWSSNDVTFINPPQHYYNEIDDKVQLINRNGFRNLLEKHGILLDLEDSEEGTGKVKYLLQIFTKPIFSKETFFFELIQRYGATGFGAGNISALWRAVDAYLREQNKFK